MNHARMHVSRFEHYDHQSPTERPSIIIHERNSENGRNRHNKTPAHHLPKSADRDSFEMPPFLLAATSAFDAFATKTGFVSIASSRWDEQRCRSTIV